MEEWLQLLISFFVTNVLGYGGGPASIPLMYKETCASSRTDAGVSSRRSPPKAR